MNANRNRTKIVPKGQPDSASNQLSDDSIDEKDIPMKDLLWSRVKSSD